MRVVLVRPIRGVNVGAVCRAIKNMDGGVLHIVGGDFDLDEARHAAVHAADVLESCRRSQSLRDALHGCSLVVGTTARGGAYRERSRDVRGAAAEIAAAEQTETLVPALVFGPEDAGLTNDEIAVCHRLAFIPTSGAYASLNLAQAVLVCLYEVMRARQAARAAHIGDRETRADETPAGRGGGPADGRGAGTWGRLDRADAAAVDDMYVALEEALLRIGFLSSQNPRHVMMTVREVIGRAGLDERELRILRGIARQILWFADGGAEVARRKRERGEKLR